MEKIILQNNIPLLIKENKQTPRIAFCLYMSIGKKEKFAGEFSLIKALLFQGTKTKTGEELAIILEENGIDCYVTSSKDYICLKLVCLNEDFKIALNILNDIVFNSTFEEFEKERIKIKGEILSDLDSPKFQAFDGFSRTIFNNHTYGNTSSVVLEQIDNLTFEDVKNSYEEILKSSQKNIAVVGDFSSFGGIKQIKNLVYDNFKDLENKYSEMNIEVPIIKGKRLVTKTKKDTAQAQVIQGWIFPTLLHPDNPKIQVMNTILGSSGLSSRLFLELREKKGLAYTVRSSYDVFKQCGCLWVYIGTNPINIQTAVDGFKIEIDKLKSDLVSEEELQGGKNNIMGKRQFLLETNIQQASIMGMYEMSGVGFDYEMTYQKLIWETTAEDIKRIANEYFTDDFVLYALADKISLKL